MSKTALIFPGQGAQFVGMGKDLYDSFPAAKAVFDQANDILGFSISDICFAGPEEELTRTVRTQVAIFVTSIAALRAAQSLNAEFIPTASCGLSLGEFTALVALDSIKFEDGLRLVQRRGELMEQAGQNNPGTMASILGLSPELTKEACDEAGAEIANLNSPDQIVITGRVEGVEKACVLAKDKGAKRVIPLKVGGAFHSSLMSEAKDGLKEALQSTVIAEPKGLFIPNVTGAPISDPEEIRSSLAEQLTSSVQWIASMKTIADFNYTQLFEVGPGRVLKGLARKINRELTVTNLGSKEELDQWMQPAEENQK